MKQVQQTKPKRSVVYQYKMPNAVTVFLQMTRENATHMKFKASSGERLWKESPWIEKSYARVVAAKNAPFPVVDYYEAITRYIKGEPIRSPKHASLIREVNYQEFKKRKRRSINV